MLKIFKKILVKFGLITDSDMVNNEVVIEKIETKEQVKSELNQITVKRAKSIGIEVTNEAPKPKKKRTYKKKNTKITDNVKKSEIEKSKKDVTTKTTNRKPRKKDSSV